MTRMRIQLELPETQVAELKQLMEEAGIDTYKDLFNNSLTMFEWALNEVKNGKILASVDEKSEKYRVLVMPLLERVAKAARRSAEPAYSASR